MKGVLLCAGEGSRMRPRTLDTPKPLVTVNGKPLLEHAFDYAIQASVTEFHLVVGYKRGQIIDSYGDSYRGHSISYYVQNERNGLAHALQQVTESFNSHFLVLLADVLYGDFPAEDLPKTETAIVTEQVPYSEASEYGVCITDTNGRITGLIEKPEHPPSNQILSGAYVLPPEIFTHCRQIPPSARGEYELTDAIASYLQAVGGRVLRGLTSKVNADQNNQTQTKTFK